MNRCRLNPQVSVVVPVYNAELFLQRCVESILEHDEVGEILLIEDSSTDNSLALCRNLEKESDRVHLCTHPGGGNRGAGETRNLGMRNARFQYLAFLDADDFYLSSRFANLSYLKENPEVDGVYHSVGTHYYNEQAKKDHFIRVTRAGSHNPDVTGLTTRCPGSQLFETLVLGQAGWLHLDGLTIRRTLLEKSGYFDPSLRIGQDTDFILRCSYFGRLESDEPSKVVACRGVHESNRILYGDNAQARSSRKLLAKKLFHFSTRYHLSDPVSCVLFHNYLDSAIPTGLQHLTLPRKSVKLLLMLYFVVRYKLSLKCLARRPKPE